MQTGVVRILAVRFGEPGLQFDEHRVARPGLARRPRLGNSASHNSSPLVAGVAAQQSVQGRGSGPRQAGDEDRRGDVHRGVLRVLLPRRLADQPCHQRVAQEEPRHLAADHGEAGLPAVGLQQDRESLTVVIVTVVVVLVTEIVESGRL